MAQKNNIIELEIEDLAFKGKGVARTDNFVWFVKHGLPGQKVKARIGKKKKNYGEAYIEEIIEPSPHQISPPCPYFGTCGGCQLQHLKYEKQVFYKTNQIKEILKRMGEFTVPEVLPTIPSRNIYQYRNKMEFSFSDKRWIEKNKEEEETSKSKNFALGLHIPKRFDKVLDIDSCLLQSDKANLLLQDIKKLTFETNLPAYNPRNHTGVWRFLVIREGMNTGELMINIFTSSQEMTKVSNVLKGISHTMRNRHPELTSFIHTVTDSLAQVAQGGNSYLLMGSPKIKEKIGDKIFEISPGTFFQTNSYQTEILFNTIASLADFRGDENVFDLYCGTGAIGITIAEKVKNIYGIEVIESAVKDGIINAELNNLDNVHFYLADIKEAMRDINDLIRKLTKPDVVILDPPRGGTHPKSIKGLLKMAPSKIIYVSCNPAILTRDLNILCESKYQLKKIQPVDMFPHTGHIEVVTVLLRN